VPDASGSLQPLLSNVQWAIVSLSLFAGAFNIEIFRSGIEAVSRSTVEAAESLGFSRWQTYRNVVLPLAFRTALPALSNNLVNLIKTTNLAYAIAVPEVMYTAKQIWGDALNVREMMFTVLIFYVCLASLFAWGMKRLEYSLRVPGIGQGA
jgi:polar amino acid transport system permease protein